MPNFLLTLRELTSWSYLTTQFPGDLSRTFFLGWLIISGLAIVGAMIIRLILTWRTSTTPAWTRWWKKYSSMAATAGIVLLILLFFRYERAPVASMRILVLSWIIIVAIWKLTLLWQAWRKVPVEVSMWRERQRINKYLPKK